MTSSDHAQRAVDRFLPRLPCSLYEIAWQYSLYDWYSAVQSGDIDWDLAPKHLAYLTPHAQSDLFAEPDSLIVVYADLSDPANPQLRPESQGGPVEITTYTAADRFRIGHSYPANKASSMTDYSITTQKSADAHHLAGLRDDTWGTNNIQDRFTDWAQSEYADAVRRRASDADAAIIEGLAALGDDEEAMAELADAFLAEANGKNEEFESLITVRVRLPNAENYRFPGEIPVLNEVMAEKKSARLENISVKDASGDGVGYVSGEKGEVTGGSPGLFGMFGKNQREHFPNIDPDGSAAWRNRPLTFDVAAAIAAADSIFEDFYRGLGSNRRLYVLPYLALRESEVDADTFAWFHQVVFRPLRNAETGEDGTFDEILSSYLNYIENARGASRSGMFSEASNNGYWHHVRLAVVWQVTGNPDRVYFDTLDGGPPIITLGAAHKEITTSPVFEGDGIFATYPSPESSPLLGQNLQLAPIILSGYYFGRTTEPTRSSRQASERPSVGDIDDHEMRRVQALLTGESIQLQQLLEEYVHQLVQDQHEQLGNDDAYIPFPRRSVVEQYTQLRALAQAGVLDTATTSVQVTTTTMTDTPDSRQERLEAFLSNHDALDSTQTRAVFLLGGLVGRITSYQIQKDVSSTLIRRYPVDYLTKQTVKEVTKEVLQMDNSYAETDQKRSYWTNQRYSSRLTDTMLEMDPESWSLSDTELQWLYSLGITYGLNDTSIERETNSDTTANPTADN